VPRSSIKIHHLTAIISFRRSIQQNLDPSISGQILMSQYSMITNSSTADADPDDGT
jgi:hypothetical protein